MPSGKLPLEVGCVVNNVGTALLFTKLFRKINTIERIVTVTGFPIKNPSNYRVRIGTPISDLLAKAEVDMDVVGKIINGGPMMGKSLLLPMLL